MSAINLRPGVFSTYTIRSSRVAGASRQGAAVCARGEGGEAGRVYRFSSPADAAGILSGPVLEGARLLLDSGVSYVACLAVGSGDAEDYRAALASVSGLDDIGAVVCDSAADEVHTLLAQSVMGASEAQRERAGFAPAAGLDRAAAQARLLNCERVCLCWPATRFGSSDSAFYSACALAAAALTAAAGENLSGAACPFVSGAGENLPETAVQELLAGGVAVLETNLGSVECIRAVTTRTLTGGAADSTFRDLSTVLVVDEVLRRARQTLKLLLRGARGNAATLQTISAQCAVLLSGAADEGLVSSFEAPRAYLDPTDRSVCIAELCFEPSTALCQIRIAARVNL